MKRAVERLGADPARAEKGVDDVDRQRDQYVRTYYGRTRHDSANYDLVLNAERLGFEGAAKLIVAEVKRRGGKERHGKPCPHARRSPRTPPAPRPTPSTPTTPPPPTPPAAPPRS